MVTSGDVGRSLRLLTSYIKVALDETGLNFTMGLFWVTNQFLNKNV